MKIFINSQDKRLEEHLKDLIRESVIPYAKERLRAQIKTIKLGTTAQLSELNLSSLFNYNIFPPSIMAFRTQWELENRNISVGDTIVQQVFIPPFRIFSQKIIFGVRINRVIDEPHRKGFSYETLYGHVEKGESTFTIEQHGDRLIFKIQTFSEPANSFVRTFGSWVAIPYQSYCTRKALENVKSQLGG